MVDIEGVAAAVLSLVDHCGPSVLRPLQNRLQRKNGRPLDSVLPSRPFRDDLVVFSLVRKTGTKVRRIRSGLEGHN